MVRGGNAANVAKSIKIGYIFIIELSERTSHTRKSEPEGIPKHPKYLLLIITIM